MAKPLLSVIVPAKDQADYIFDSFTSLTRQFADSSQMQVVLVDDGSRDGTGELAATFSDRLPGLQILRNPAPAGVASARNKGLAEATGRYITFLDADDWYAAGHLERLTEEIRQLGCDFVRVDHIRSARGLRTVHRAPQARRGVVLDPRASVLPIDVASMVDYPFPAFGIFDSHLKDAGLLHFLEGLHTAEDRPWIWRLHLQAQSYAVSDELGVFYRRGNPGSLTQLYDRRQLDFLRCFEEIFRMLANDAEAERFWPKAARQFYAITCHHLKRAPLMDRLLVRQLRNDAGRVLSLLPESVFRLSIAELDVPRQKLLGPVLHRRVA